MTASIDLFTDIGGWFGMTAAEMKYRLSELKGEEVEIHIHSGGGDCFEGFALHSVLSQYAGRKVAVIDGICASAATFVAMACDERQMNVASMYMVHLPWAFTGGDAADHEDTAKVLRQITECMVKIYVARTGQEESTVRSWMAGKDVYFTPEEAKAVGLCDSILNVPSRVNAAAEVGKFLAMRKLPAKRAASGLAARTHQVKGAPMNYLEKLGLSAESTPADVAAAILSYCSGSESEDDKKATLAGLITQLQKEPDEGGAESKAALKSALGIAQASIKELNVKISELEQGKAAAAKQNEPSPQQLAESAVKAGRWPAHKLTELIDQFGAGKTPYLFEPGTFTARGMAFTQGGNPAPASPVVEPKAGLNEADQRFLATVNGRNTRIDPKAFAAAKAARAGG